jgi:hypothetical protein
MTISFLLCNTKYESIKNTSRVGSVTSFRPSEACVVCIPRPFMGEGLWVKAVVVAATPNSALVQT